MSSACHFAIVVELLSLCHRRLISWVCCYDSIVLLLAASIHTMLKYGVATFEQVQGAMGYQPILWRFKKNKQAASQWVIHSVMYVHSDWILIKCIKIINSYEILFMFLVHRMKCPLVHVTKLSTVFINLILRHQIKTDERIFFPKKKRQ